MTPANPVLRKELRIWLRLGGQSAAQRTGVRVVLALPAILIYLKAFAMLRYDPSAACGRGLWMLTVCGQFAFVCLIAPGLAANAVSQEREQRTWETLVFTRLTAGDIIMGKLLARFVPVPVVMAVGLPLALAGAHQANQTGTEVGDVIGAWLFAGAYVTLFVTGLLFTACGLFLSWRLQRTVYALMGTYAFVFGVLIIGTFLVSGMLAAFLGDAGFIRSCPLMWFNPLMLIKNAVAPDGIRDTVFLVCGLLGYLALTALMLRRMTSAPVCEEHT